MMSIDLANAFGSTPHAAISSAIRRAGIGEDAAELLEYIISDNKTVFTSDNASSDPIYIPCGVRQGDPLSGCLFNFAFNPVIQSVFDMGNATTILVFADDVFILADSPSALQAALDVFTVSCAQAGMSVNPNKCFSLHIQGRPRRCLETIFFLNQVPISVRLDGEVESFLGKPIGFSIAHPRSEVDEFYSTGKKLLESSLAPWQKLDAIKTFLFPSFNYAQRVNAIPSKTAWRSLDEDLRPLIRSVLALPPRASLHYLYGHPEDTLLGIPESATDYDVAQIDSAFKLLTSSDSRVKDMAWNDLRHNVKHCMASPESNIALLSNYLSGDRTSRSAPNSSIFTRARAASHRLGVRWCFNSDGSILLLHRSRTIADRTKIFKSLRDNLRHEHTDLLRLQRNQGKTTACFSKDKVSAHYNRTGDFIRFADWRFVHKARLNLHKINGTKRTNDREQKLCRRCHKDIEYLAHIICHCHPKLKKITARHNDIVARIKKAAVPRWSVYSENQPIAGSNLKPDLVVQRGESLIIFDVAVTFENGVDAFNHIRDEKINKYKDIARTLANRYTDVRIEPVIVGALGSWDPRNDNSLKRICSKKYLRLMKKFIVSDTLRSSRDIYYEHITGKQQNQHHPKYRKVASTPKDASLPHPPPAHRHHPSTSPEVFSLTDASLTDVERENLTNYEIILNNQVTMSSSAINLSPHPVNSRVTAVPDESGAIVSFPSRSPSPSLMQNYTPRGDQSLLITPLPEVSVTYSPRLSVEAGDKYFG